MKIKIFISFLSAHIDIVEPPVSHVTLAEGTPIQLKCTADIETNIGWLKHKAPVQHGVDGYVITEGTEGTFKASVLTRQDVVMEEAIYTCVNQDDPAEKDQVHVDYGGMMTSKIASLVTYVRGRYDVKIEVYSTSKIQSGFANLNRFFLRLEL